MKKYWLAIVLFTMVLMALPAYAYPYDPTTDVIHNATDYLNSTQDDTGMIRSFGASSWATMALASADIDPHDVRTSPSNPSVVDYLRDNGDQLSSATDYERYIMSVCAAGEDPNNFGGHNYTADLVAFYDGTQMGDSTLLNDDTFGVMALVCAGVPPTSEMIQNITTFIKNNQNADGGWSWAVGGDSDTDDTAAAILALMVAGEDPSSQCIQDALAFLQTTQNDDGGFGWSPSDTDSNANSDAYGIMAIRATGGDPTTWTQNGTSPSPIDHLLSLQRADGGFAWMSGSTLDATPDAVVALTGKFYPQHGFKNSLRVEGKNETLFNGSVFYTAPYIATADNSGNNFPTFVGPKVAVQVETMEDISGVSVYASDEYGNYYVKAIGGEFAQGAYGWLYVVNYESPSVGAGDYILGESDEVLWYYGAWNAKLSRLIVPSTVTVNESFTALVEYYNNTASQWQPLEGAYVWMDGSPIAGPTDANGEVDVTIASTGTHKLWSAGEQTTEYPGGDWTQVIRSEKVDVEVQEQTPTFVPAHVRVESNTTTLFDAVIDVPYEYTIYDTDGTPHNFTQPTALGALDKASQLGGFTYNVTNSSWGLYISDINGDSYVYYWVNYTMPWVGADQYVLNGDEYVLFGTGNYWPYYPTKIVAPSPTACPFNATVYYYNDTSSQWLPLEGATVLVDGIPASGTTNVDGNISLTLSDGTHTLKAEKEGYVRSEGIEVEVSNTATMYVSPSTTTAKIGDTFTIDVRISSVAEVYGAQYTISFDPAVFEVVSQSKGTFLSSDGALTTIYANNWDDDSVWYAECRSDTSTGVSGDGVLASIEFRVKDNATTGSYVLEFVADECNVSSPTAQPIDTVLVNGSVEVVEFIPATMTIEPSLTSVRQGDEFVLDITVDSGDYSVYQAEYTISFDPSVFEAISQTQGDFLSSDGAETIVLINTYDDNNAMYSETRNATDGISGSGVLASVEFRVKGGAASGDYNIAFVSANLYDVSGDAIPLTTSGAVVTVENTPPVADFSMTHTVNNVYAPVDFDASDSYDPDGSIVSYEWDFGDGNTDTGEVVSHTYTTYQWDGSGYVPYQTTLTVEDNEGGIGTKTVDVYVYMAGDANGDGRVNILDAALIGLHWNSQYGEANYDDGADLNNDDRVNILDAAIVGLHWNEEA